MPPALGGGGGPLPPPVPNNNPQPPPQQSQQSQQQQPLPPQPGIVVNHNNTTTTTTYGPTKLQVDAQLCGPNDFQPGNFGIYASLFLVVSVMVGCVLILNYGPLVPLAQWTSDCPVGFENACKSVGGVYRFAFALSCIFFLQLLGTLVYTKFFDYAWPVKYTCFVATLIGFFFVKAEVFDLNGFAWFARIAAFMYLVSQQVILLDFAYTWNEQWVRWSEEADAEGSGNARAWLVGLVVVSLTLFAGSLAVIGVLFWQFQGCPDSTAIISLTLILSVVVTVFQLFVSDDGSLLTSSIMTAYATYICYSAVILNPNTACNPTLSTGYQTISKGIGIGILILSLAWATHTTIAKIKEGSGFMQADVDATAAPLGSLNPTVLPTSGEGSVPNPYAARGLKTVLAEVSLVFILVSCYFAMVLTNWATVQSNYGLATANSGTAAMWLQASGQWVAIFMYAWSLVAPKLFPDRDFSGGSAVMMRPATSASVV
jgi:hypothetical protein